MSAPSLGCVLTTGPSASPKMHSTPSRPKRADPAKLHAGRMTAPTHSLTRAKTPSPPARRPAHAPQGREGRPRQAGPGSPTRPRVRSGPVDGVFGDKTERAVQGFHQARGLEVH